MDVATHAVTGAVVWLACKNRPQTGWGLPLAMAAAASPDVDVFFAGTPLEFLLLHRGITHSLAALPFMAVILAVLMDSLWRKTTPGAWKFTRVILFAAALLLIHIGLDCVTTYGTMIFTPFSDYRVRLNGLFIVDLLLLIPLLAAWHFGRKKRLAALLGVAWIFLYPSAMVVERMVFEHQWKENIFADNKAGELYVLPDVFAPARWRAIYEKNGELRQIGLDWRGRLVAEDIIHPVADPGLMAGLSTQDRSCRAFFRFMLLPTQQKLSEGESKGGKDENTKDADGKGEEIKSGGGKGGEFLFYDLRFASMIPFVRKVMDWRSNGEIPFKLAVKLDENGKLEASRMIFSGANRISEFAPPDPPGRVSPWQWLAGIK